ncbi:hypothetical protein K5X82_06500 [Halosquirtibacter xylanolyticus]|uniref:endonuclease/exonuclease/phosphatase family protein n=1 Tax=Halosquirtibacter xylanolyticus TaxID=3374599 RepID=UPI00374A5CE0|nr:hypothetical protein K5X82_06500 [Prolixibacteraceae bacterium]
MNKTTQNTLLVLLLTVFLVGCQMGSGKKKVTVVSYNVENLFDTSNDPNTKDDDFTPDGYKKWTEDRYQKKIKDLAKVLAASADGTLPTVIGLCEIENRKVLEDLANSAALKDANYAISHFESPYYRGMDVGLLYNPKLFKVKSEKVLPVTLLSDPKFTTRDILCVTGKLAGETFTFYVNHWSSRRGGSEKSEPKRMIAASILRRDVDRVIADNPKANIVIMGDMNEDPNEYALNDVLRAGDLPSDISTIQNDGTLYNLMYFYDKQGKGTYNYHGMWNMLDNMIVSSNVIKKSKGLGVEIASMEKRADSFPTKIFIEDWFTFESDLGKTSPSKTYGGPNYYGGYSDHYPVVLKLTRK